MSATGYDRAKSKQPDTSENHPAYGQYYVSSAAATTITAAGGPVKAAGTTTADGLSKFTMPANNRLTCGGDNVAIYKYSASCAILSDTDTQVTAAVYKNGSAITSTSVQVDVLGTGTPIESVDLTWVGPLKSTDYLEIFLDVEDDADVTLKNACVNIYQVY